MEDIQNVQAALVLRLQDDDPGVVSTVLGTPQVREKNGPFFFQLNLLVFYLFCFLFSGMPSDFLVVLHRNLEMF